MEIPHYPASAPIGLEMRAQLHPILQQLPDGVSEFTFAGLYLFRRTYDYHLSWISAEDGHQPRLLVTGHKEGKRFFMLPCGFPPSDTVIRTLLGEFDYLKGLGHSTADAACMRLQRLGFRVIEDRDNFDYLYLREELASLAGRKFHKKRNHVNAFLRDYSWSEAPLTVERVGEAMGILEAWQSSREDRADYEAAKEALDLFAELELTGHLVYVEGVPAAYAVGEPLAEGRHFVVHFEKALDEYRGVYQFINKAFAEALPERYTFINREQDLGDEGLRQSKLTYRPAGFVKKFRVVRADSSEATIAAAEGTEHRPADGDDPSDGADGADRSDGPDGAGAAAASA